MLHFTKMHAAGNDFIVVDATKKPFCLEAQEIRVLADRHYGIGFDQLLVVQPSNDSLADFGYQIFNADGSEAQMCGNGARCFALFVLKHGLTEKKSIAVRAKHGLITLEVLDENFVRVKMGRARFVPKEIPFLANSFESKLFGKAVLYKEKEEVQTNWFGVVNMGNPHAIFVVEKATEAPLKEFAQSLQHTRAFPEGVNVSVLEVLSKREAFLRVHERGVGETLACGSGACAAFALAHQMGLLGEKAAIKMPGGQVTVEIDKNSDIFLTGSAEAVFEGQTLERRKGKNHD